MERIAMTKVSYASVGYYEMTDEVPRFFGVVTGE
jgi:hypothetical protein